jgi:UDP-N-acetyl-D-galactosamine dehydrogenase
MAEIFNLLYIDTQAVLEAAGTKWNFLPFKTGLIGEHFIGVYLYHLAQKAQEVDYHPENLVGIRLSDNKGQYVVTQIIKKMISKEIKVNGAEILLLGITLKENCPDGRNTKIIDVIRAIKDCKVNITIYDHLANPAEVMYEYGLSFYSALEPYHPELVSASLGLSKTSCNSRKLKCNCFRYSTFHFSRFSYSSAEKRKCHCL